MLVTAETSQAVIAGLREAVGERPPWHPLKEHHPTLAWHSRIGGVHEATPVGGPDETNDVDLALPLDRLQPAELDLDIGV